MSLDYKIHPDFEHLEEELLHAHRYFHDSQQSIHKARNELRLVTIGEEQMVIKRFKTSRLHDIRYKDSKAKRSYEMAMRVMSLGINTPPPVAYVNTYNGRELTKSFYIDLFDTFDFTMRPVLHHDIEDHEKILKAYVAFAHTMHLKGVVHTDNVPDNTIVLKEKGDYRFSLVDIHRVQLGPVTSMDAIKSLAMLGAVKEDLKVIASEYAGLSGLDERKTYLSLRRYTSRISRVKKIKAWFKS